MQQMEMEKIASGTCLSCLQSRSESSPLRCPVGSSLRACASEMD
uniref:Uncharacterized protein n=1 Tax=Anguilla anguilla TaxID=7936 RepID=A0A0E9V2R9_ANGAN